eukprot:scaffold9388_cov148-Skeletonema_marinoi.AAC.4
MDYPSAVSLVDQSAEMKEKMMDCPSDVSLAKKSAEMMGADLADQSVDLKTAGVKVRMTDCLSDECLDEQSADLTAKMMDGSLAVSLVEKTADLMAASLAEESDEMMVRMTASSRRCPINIKREQLAKRCFGKKDDTSDIYKQSERRSHRGVVWVASTVYNCMADSDAVPLPGWDLQRKMGIQRLSQRPFGDASRVSLLVPEG